MVAAIIALKERNAAGYQNKKGIKNAVTGVKSNAVEPFIIVDVPSFEYQSVISCRNTVMRLSSRGM